MAWPEPEEVAPWSLRSAPPVPQPSWWEREAVRLRARHGQSGDIRVPHIVHCPLTPCLVEALALLAPRALTPGWGGAEGGAEAQS